MIFVDSNVPMYLVGAPHPHKVDSQRLLERCLAEQERLLTDVEVLQEVLHRYAAIGCRDAIAPAFEALLSVVDEVFPIELVDVERARGILLAAPQLSARDAIHAAVMERRGISTILTFDIGFDLLPGVKRIS
ncbi:MAG TPA: type II toxin-antitoxin system VapC family toxin [Vicinamibacteria bacterium]|nr:type II toxin-antitoxin system VapC family toxin [Vicinamibacteria bacterium]